MTIRMRVALLLVGALGAAGAATAYPGGTPGYQTDVAPFCASCHASRSVDVLAGAPGDYATKQLAENQHLALIRAGKKGYADLSEAERARLVEQVKALDAASSVVLEAPSHVAPGARFEVTVRVTGGAGPVVGVGLVDATHRWLARPAASAGWQVVAPPRIRAGGGAEQTEWLARRPAELGRNLSFVNVREISSDSEKRQWASAQVVFTLRAPAAPATLPLAASYWYGTETASPLGTLEDPIRGKQPRGGFGGHSGRVIFSDLLHVEVR